MEDYVLPKIQDFLAPIGLSLNKAKTSIRHISEGFDFLGFHFQRFIRKDGSINNFRYHPARKRVDNFLRDLKMWLRKHLSESIQDVIKGLNRRIRGFCNYFKWSNAHKAFAYMNHRIYKMMWNFVRHRHQRKRGARWLKYQYWRPTHGKQWIFNFKGVALIQPYNLTVKWWKRPPVRIHTSPFDAISKEYWEQRKQRTTWIKG